MCASLSINQWSHCLYISEYIEYVISVMLDCRLLFHHSVTRSLFKINLYAARGPRNQTGSFYTDFQRNVTTQTHVSLQFITLYSIITAHCTHRQLSELEQRSWCAKQSLAMHAYINSTLIISNE